MKFGKEYQAALTKGEFPAQWVYAAISYRQLKKCIKKVRQELQEMGLDTDTLSHLLRASNIDKAYEESHATDQPFEYRLLPEIHARNVAQQQPSQDVRGAGALQGFRPKLVFAIDEETGEPFDACLSPDTKQYLHQLAISQRLSDVRVTELPGSSISATGVSSTLKDTDVQKTSSRTRMVEVPLSSDSIFFKKLQSELFGLERMQAEEKVRLSVDVKSMGKTLSKSTEPSRALSAHKSDLSVWREIFQLYMEAEIFFSPYKPYQGSHPSKQVLDRLEKFSRELKSRSLESKFKRKDSKFALNQFLVLNAELFKNLRFQEIEYTAMTKILKSKLSTRY